MTELITITEAAKLAGRTRAAIHRWIKDGWLNVAYRPTEARQPVLIDKTYFVARLPELLKTMEQRKGGNGVREPKPKPKPKKGKA
jgi:hypothetical protein